LQFFRDNAPSSELKAEIEEIKVPTSIVLWRVEELTTDLVTVLYFVGIRQNCQGVSRFMLVVVQNTRKFESRLLRGRSHIFPSSVWNQRDYVLQ
jgi:hypothetical protein